MPSVFRMCDTRDFPLTRSEVRDSPCWRPILPPLFTWKELASGENIARSGTFDLVSIEGRVVAEVRQATQDEYVLDRGRPSVYGRHSPSRS